MALPTGYEERTRDEWLKLASDSDAQKRKIVSNCVRDLGVLPTDYMGWDPETRVDYIMKHQEGAKKAAPAAEPEETGKAKKGKASESAASAGGGGGLTAADRAMLKGLDEKLDALTELNTKIHNLLVVSVLSSKSAKENAEEMDVELPLNPIAFFTE
jgi:hypothetical protein